ncbi:uncharacterized protein IUM83_01441 [Phytophthora cinnamomi]|uniref:uncharacterized protein n=1 Tax=Phytophthora cinnamomi TaxID=4785 RepID=UPI00355A6DEA|nr:hypothetical protein IUM83_01441 [Phytophthora cinnamomi]
MPPKRSSRGAKAPSKPRAVRPKAKKAKAKNESAAQKEATGAAAEEVRSPPRRDWDSPEFSSTKVVYLGESSQEEEDTSEGSAQAANDKKPEEGDVSNAPADPDTQAEVTSSGKTGIEPMAAPPVKNLTPGEGLAHLSYHGRRCCGERRPWWEEACLAMTTGVCSMTPSMKKGCLRAP